MSFGLIFISWIVFFNFIKTPVLTISIAVVFTFSMEPDQFGPRTLRVKKWMFRSVAVKHGCGILCISVSLVLIPCFVQCLVLKYVVRNKNGISLWWIIAQIPLARHQQTCNYPAIISSTFGTEVPFRLESFYAKFDCSVITPSNANLLKLYS